LDKAKNNENVNLYGTNDPLRNYIYIDDLITIISKVVQLKVEGIYSCTNMLNVTYSQIAKAAFSAFKSKRMVNFDKDKPDIPNNVFEINDELYKRIGFYPQITIEEGINRIAAFIIKDE
jgi:nucleoside-diphosphate-sugar epimerase